MAKIRIFLYCDLYHLDLATVNNFQNYIVAYRLKNNFVSYREAATYYTLAEKSRFV